jgi:hypothetical protein
VKFLKHNALSQMLYAQKATKAPLPRQNAGAKAARNAARSQTLAAAKPTAAQLELARQERIAAERLANLEKARAVKAANAARKAVKETTPMPRKVSELEALKIELAALRTQIAALSTTSAPATPAPAPAKAKAPAAPAPAAQEEPVYVRTHLKLENHGKGQRSLVINGVKVSVNWNGATKAWDYACGKRKGTAADRGAAFAQLNLLTTAAGLGMVRA